MKAKNIIICALTCLICALCLTAAALTVGGYFGGGVLYTLLFTCGCCAALYLAARFSLAYTRRRAHRMYAAFAVMFVLYCALAAYFLFFAGAFGRGEVVGLTLAQYAKKYLSLKPFYLTADMLRRCAAGEYTRGFVVRNLAGNVAAFMPCALFLPLLFKCCRRFWVFLAGVAAAVCCVELLQLFFMRGCCDIDDLIYNTAGAALMFWLLHLPRVRKRVRKMCWPLRY